MILNKNNGMNYSLFNSTSINSEMRNIKCFKTFYFKINYVPSLEKQNCQYSNFISKTSKKNVTQIVARDSIKKKILIPYSNKNFKVYFLFVIFYFDKIRSNILSASVFYNSFLRPFKYFRNQEISKGDKPFQGYMNNGLNYKEFKTEESNRLKKKDYKNINIFKNSVNYTRPIHFFRIIKKSNPFILPFSLIPTVPKTETLINLTHSSFHSERLIDKRLKLIRVSVSGRGTKGRVERENDIRVYLYKKVFINSKLNFFKTIIKNIIDSEISLYKILCKSSLHLFNIFLINVIESNLNSDYFQYKNKLQKLQFESSSNQFIWYYKIKQNKVIYILKKVLTLINLSLEHTASFINCSRNYNGQLCWNTFFSNYYYLNILIIKQDKNLPYSLKIIYLNLHYRIWSIFKLLLTGFFNFLFNFNSRILNIDGFFNLKTKLIKKYTLNSQKQISSIIQKSIKKSKIYKIKKYLNQGLWQLNKKDHNQNSLKWIFNKYWLNINYSVIISKNLTVYYSFKSNNINLLSILFNKMLLTKKIDSNLTPKTFLFQSNILNTFKIRYKVYLTKIVLKNKNCLNLNLQKNITNLSQIDEYTILLDKKVFKLTYFFNLQFFNLVKYNVPINKKYQPIILFKKTN